MAAELRNVSLKIALNGNQGMWTKGHNISDSSDSVNSK
jgi:hypothetical protein